MTQFFLKPTIKAEPLIWKWYAWPYLIPPLPAACHVVDRHMKIMQSYIQNPQIHAQAIKNPKLLGGSFIDLEGQKVEEILELISQTRKDCEKLINLQESYKEFDRTLQNEAQGDSLESYYNRIPSPLKGMVELVYNLNNRPSIRLIEPLIYKNYYSTQPQTIALSETNEDFRKFILATPRLDQENEVYLDTPFCDSRLDKLFRMKNEPKSYEEVLEVFQIPQSKQNLFNSFFTTTPPNASSDRNYTGEGIRLRYFGHACILVQTKSVSILFDPVLSYPIQSAEVPRYTISDLPDHIDYVIITHNHQDHVMFETLLQLRHKIGKVVFPANNRGSLEDPSLDLIFKHTGFSSRLELKEFESIDIENGQIVGLPFLGEHSDLNIQSKLSYFVQIKDKKFLFAADSNNLDSVLYDHIFDYTGPIDILFLGMECEGAPLTWIYGPLLSNPLKKVYDRNRTLSGSNYEKAFSIFEKSKCKRAYVYAMGQEPWLNYLMALKYLEDSPQMIESNKFVNSCRERGVESERLFGRKEWILI